MTPEELPEDIALSLLKGVAAFIRATPTQDLPANVRRFAGFRTAGLIRQRDALLGFLFDDTTRPRVAEWIDEGKPPLSKQDVENLRLAVAQEDGWAEALIARSTQAGQPTGIDDGKLKAVQKDLERERTKVQKQKDEARRVKEEAVQEQKRAKAVTAGLEKQLADLAQQLATQEKHASESAGRAASATEERDREVRRAKSEVAKAQAEVERLRDEVRAARREAAWLKEQVLDLEEQLAKKKKRKVPSKQVALDEPTGPRKPLAVPRGRFEDDPQTLAAWMDVPGVLLVIDGYNVTRHESGYATLPFAGQRERLLDGVERLARRRKLSATIVWDAQYMTTAERPAATVSRRSPVTEIFTAEGEIADDRIVKLLETGPPYPAVVATNDRELRDRVGALGATVATSQQLLSLLP